MDTIGTQTENPVLSNREVTEAAAQRLYDQYRQMGFSPAEWISLLQDVLGSGNSERVALPGVDTSVKKDIGAKVNGIIKEDKRVPLEELDESGRLEIIREVTEWLTAEKIVSKMAAYEAEIREGIEKGYFVKIGEVLEVLMNKEDDFFPDENSGQNLKELIRDNFVIDMRGGPLGEGARVCVRELLPVHFPFPIPKRDELREGLMLKYPNNRLVIRMMRSSYRAILGNYTNESEKRSIATLVRAAPSFTFSGESGGAEKRTPDAILDEQRESMMDTLESQSVLRREISHKKNGGEEYSFIPPMVVLKIKISENSEPAFVTIQKRIVPRGTLIGTDKRLEKDLMEIPGFLDKARHFTTACKNFYRKEKRLPDVTGHANVLYTEKGNIYLVDVNNITEEPDYRLLALMVLIKKVLDELESPYSNEDKDEFGGALSDAINEAVESLKQYAGHENADAEEVLNLSRGIYNYDENRKSRDFLKTVRFFDDLCMPAFLANVNRLNELEEKIIKIKHQRGEISDEQLPGELSALKEDSLYGINNPFAGYSKNARGCASAEAIKDRKAGNDRWVLHYANLFIRFYRQWTEGGIDFGNKGYHGFG